ncbi:MAG: hypothetical protein DRP51_01365 [Candidatus Zixiibacteriota bacterium]|nr:MAG: hypothetical protein DRP51_01365 [candidate division Zixibacteria bacterium]
MDIGFIERTLRTAGILSLLVLIFGSFYYGFIPSLSVFTGLIWGIVNLYFLSLLVRATIRPDDVDKVGALVILFIKIPLLYLAGYFLVTSILFDPILLLIGFSVLLLVIVLKAIGRTIMNLDHISGKERQGTVNGA